MSYTGKNGELNFEKDLIKELQNNGWEKDIIINPTEDDLIENWMKIIFESNKGKLGNVPLSKDEKNQIMEYVKLNCNTPVKANKLILGKNICVTRDSDSKDTEHAGMAVYLDIFNYTEIAGGNSRYQIIEQPIFKTSSKYNDRRGDIMLLINGMPVIHIELKASGISVSEATNQIQKYIKEGVFTGLFNLVQVFFAITPEDAVYFANYGEYTKCNDTFFFHWADKVNVPIHDWRQLCSGENSILSIPEAHSLIAYYVIADKDRDVLKVIRSYQYQAIKQILRRTRKQKWGNHDPLGGYIWATTGSGKTLISYKTGQMIIDLQHADKVVFVVDRIELDTQSYREYNSFARDGEGVKQTKSSEDLFQKLKSNNFDDSLIITSIQKLSRINEDATKQKASDLNIIQNKRIVFIIDEAQRSQFGEMHEKVKNTFYNALFFGFTGTPIFSENDKAGNTTKTVFGECLAIYSISDGIRDGNVLGFYSKGVLTFQDNDLRRVIALDKCKARTVQEAKNDTEKWKVYRNIYERKMVTEYKNGRKIEGIEDLLPVNQYNTDEHRNSVVDDILNNWDVLAYGEKGTLFHALLCTASIPEAIEYYHIFKNRNCGLNVTALFDATIDNSGQKALDKEDALIEIVEDYEKQYNISIDRNNDPNLSKFKNDIIRRLSHKGDYKNIGNNHDECIDILIVVDQLLTGFDSVYVNTLYLDRVKETDSLIQAISRTNRVYDKEEKPFGIFKFYRKPHTMKEKLKEALKLYCEGDSSGVEVPDLNQNIININNIYSQIQNIFAQDNITNFSTLPVAEENQFKFKKLFKNMKVIMNSIHLQGFQWNSKEAQNLTFDEKTYHILAMRYLDLIHNGNISSSIASCSYALNSVLSEMEMDRIDADYLEVHFKKVVPIIANGENDIENILEEFKKECSILSAIDQKYADVIMKDIKNKILIVDESKTLSEYISEYKENNTKKKIKEVSDIFELNENLLYEMVKNTTSEKNINDNSRLTNLKDSANKAKRKEYFNNHGYETSNPVILKNALGDFLKDFVLNKKYLEIEEKEDK